MNHIQHLPSSFSSSPNLHVLCIYVCGLCAFMCLCLHMSVYISVYKVSSFSETHSLIEPGIH